MLGFHYITLPQPCSNRCKSKKKKKQFLSFQCSQSCFIILIITGQSERRHVYTGGADQLGSCNRARVSLLAIGLSHEVISDQ